MSYFFEYQYNISLNVEHYVFDLAESGWLHIPLNTLQHYSRKQVHYLELVQFFLECLFDLLAVSRAVLTQSTTNYPHTKLISF